MPGKGPEGASDIGWAFCVIGGLVGWISGPPPSALSKGFCSEGEVG